MHEYWYIVEIKYDFVSSTVATNHMASGFTATFNLCCDSDLAATIAAKTSTVKNWQLMQKTCNVQLRHCNKCPHTLLRCMHLLGVSNSWLWVRSRGMQYFRQRWSIMCVHKSPEITFRIFYSYLQHLLLCLWLSQFGLLYCSFYYHLHGTNCVLWSEWLSLKFKKCQQMTSTWFSSKFTMHLQITWGQIAQAHTFS